jgi:hypothetical protein
VLVNRDCRKIMIVVPENRERVRAR